MTTPRLDANGMCSCGTNAHSDTRQCAANREATGAYMRSLSGDGRYDAMKTRVLCDLPALPDGWDAVTGTQHDPAIIALRSREYRESSTGDVVFVYPGQYGYTAAAQAIR